MLFGQIREKLPPNLSLVNEVSEALNISYDSAYRRIRGDKCLSIDEVGALCRRFDLSMDALLHLSGRHVVFNTFPVAPDQFVCNGWLEFILNHLQKIVDAKDKKIIYVAKDPPIFNYLQFPEMVAFKLFFWGKTLFQSHEHDASKFSLNRMDDDVAQKCRRIAEINLKIPTIEIWNEDTFRIFMRQIEYYWVSGYFEQVSDLEKLLDAIENWLRHIKQQAEYGFKFRYGAEPVGIENTYALYENELVLNDNTLGVNVDGVCTVYLTYNVLGLLSTTNAEFCESVRQFQKVLMAKSNLISQTGEKARNRFFNKLQSIIEQFKATHLV